MTPTIFLLDGSVVSHYIKGSLDRNCFLFQVNLCLDLTSDSMIYNSALVVRGPAISPAAQEEGYPRAQLPSRATQKDTEPFCCPAQLPSLALAKPLGLLQREGELRPNSSRSRGRRSWLPQKQPAGSFKARGKHLGNHLGQARFATSKGGGGLKGAASLKLETQRRNKQG